MLSEIKENVQGTNSGGKETWAQINGLDQKEEINIRPQHNEETRIQKNEERLRNLQDNFKHSRIRLTGVPEGEEEEQKTENLFEKIMKENFISFKGNRLPGSPGSSESPQKAGPKEEHTKAHHHYICLLYTSDAADDQGHV